MEESQHSVSRGWVHYMNQNLTSRFSGTTAQEDREMKLESHLAASSLTQLSSHANIFLVFSLFLLPYGNEFY